MSNETESLREEIASDWTSRGWRRRCSLIFLIPAVYVVYFWHRLFHRNDHVFDRDPDECDTVSSFEASEPDHVEYRPTTDTLEDAAAATSEYNVYTERRVEIDPDRLEEWVRANYDDETRVKIQTKHGADVLLAASTSRPSVLSVARNRRL